jgi:competence protein ComEC
MQRKPERTYSMAKRKKNRITFPKILIILLLLAVYSLLSYTGVLNGSRTAGQNSTDTIEVHFIDVGQGDSIYIKMPSQDILIDAGERGRGDAVINYLRNQNVQDLELVVGTHPHSDHIGGLVNVLKTFPTKEVVDPGVVHTSKTYEEYLQLIDTKNITFTEGRAGMRRNYDDSTRLEILSPTNPDEKNLNEDSVVIKLTHGNVAFLFTGDAGSRSEKEMLRNGYSLKSTILKVGHHGSYSSTSRRFLKAVSPEVAIISCGTGNSYGHPHKVTLNKLKAANADIYRTDQNGSIVVKTDGKTYQVTTER